MFVVLYRWQIKPEKERQFIESWTEVTEYYVKHFGSLGSRLHRGSDGIFYSYAQWHSEEQREQAFQNIPELAARPKMRECIEEAFPEIKLEIVSDALFLNSMSER